MTPPKVAIIGGGLGGLTLAIALQKRSIPYEVYEARASFTEIGAGINLGPNTLHALKLIDEAAGAAVHDLCTKNPPGKEDVWFQMRLGAPTQRFEDAHLMFEHMAPPTGNSTVRRNDLLKLLADVAGSEHASFNKKVSGLKQTEDGVRVSFTDDTEENVSAIIACDGIHSAVRRAMLGDDNPAAEPLYSESGAYRAVVPMETLQDAIGPEMARTSAVFLGPSAYAIMYPVEGAQSVNVGLWPYRPGSWPHREWLLPSQGAEMNKQFAAWGETVHKVMKVMGDPPFFAAYHHASQPASFHDGTVCLMGDAAHAMPPHQGAGAGQAIEDAYVLAEVLQDVDWQSPTKVAVQQAFAAFEAVRKPRFQQALESSVEGLDAWNGFWRLDLTEQDVEGIRERMLTRFHWLHYYDIAGQAQKARDMMSGRET